MRSKIVNFIRNSGATADTTPTNEAPEAGITIRLVKILLAMVLAVLLLTTFGPLRGVAFAASAPAVNQCNGTDNVGGEAVACNVTVANNLNQATGLASSTLTVRECHGAANAPPTCTTSTTSSSQLTTSVTQCNGSGSGGGGTVDCNVSIINTITGTATPAPATVNQCNTSAEGGGTQPTLVCSPIGVTTNATVTQCNGSGNGGGGMMRVLCSVPTSTETAAVPVTVNQCVGSGNGGGSTVTCTVSLTNHVLSPAASGGGAGTGSGSGTAGTPTGTGTGTPTGTGTGAPGGTGTGTPTGIPNGTGTGTPNGPGVPVPSLTKSPPGLTNLPPRVGTPPVAPTGNLAQTGIDLGRTVLIGLMAVALGTFLVLLRRRSAKRLVLTAKG